MKNIIVGILAIGCIIGAIAYSNGYIPTEDTLELVAPVGNIQTDIGEDKIAQLEQVLGDEDLKSIKYQIYQTDKSVEEIYEEYKSSLESQGYVEKMSGFELVEGHPVFYYAFVKGLVGVAFAISIIDNETYALYSTGNVLDYIEMKEKLETKV